MEEATEYKNYLKALKKATDSVNEGKKSKSKRSLRITEPVLRSRGGGISIQGTKFEGVK